MSAFWRLIRPVAALLAIAVFVPASISAAQTPPARVGGAIKEPVKIKHVEPAYPEIARAARVQGVVILEILVGKTGSVTDVKVLRSVPLLEAAAVGAVWQWRYVPTLVNEEPVELLMTVTVNFTLRAGSAGADQALPLPVGGAIKEPVKIKHVEPAYPEIARAARVQGVVILEIVVGKTGSVDDAKVLRSVPLLDAAAVEAVRQWRYTPTLVNEEPVELLMTVTVNFGLRGGSRVADQTTPLRVGGAIKEPVKIKHVAPAYPKEAMSAGVQGMVVLEVVIDKTGSVTDVKVLRSVPLLEDAAVEAVRQWRYTPTLVNEEPVDVVMTVTVNFRLGSE